MERQIWNHPVKLSLMNEQKKANQTSNSAEACNGTSNSNEHDYCGSSNHENNTAVPRQQTWIPCMVGTEGWRPGYYKFVLRSKLKQLRFIGRMIGFAICQDLLLDLHLSKPFVKQILGIPLSLPDDLMSFDYELHKNAVVSGVDALNPWNSKPVTIDLTDDSDKKLTDDNKEEYIKLVSQFKLETSIKDEVAEFAGGLNEALCETLACFPFGTQTLRGPGRVMLDVGFVNLVSTIVQNPKVTAINSCIEVDLTGQVVSDSIGTRMYSGVGGQIDFFYVEQPWDLMVLSLESPYLFGKNLRQERLMNSIKIAHPDHREGTGRQPPLKDSKCMPSPD
ncbi:hypothetical protein OS493_020732 [Desmophyllum pertusum]|uniref:HECT domain-containing protein n=1 Tax=Desmophyllum pertusum TaxID=174260 RepID=A0A9W9YN03_9CNID|nr:hypothetical protein OS493_020732 [Desmophyllum pertusum]